MSQQPREVKRLDADVKGAAPRDTALRVEQDGPLNLLAGPKFLSDSPVNKLIPSESLSNARPAAITATETLLGKL